MADTLPKKPMSAKPKKISDIASMFGGMAKMKKVKTPRHLKKSPTQSQTDLFKKKMEKLKHVDDAKKNLFAMNLSSENVYDYNLRKSPLPHTKYSNRDNSPMPPLFILPNGASSASSCDTSPYSEKAPRSFMDCPQLQLLNMRDNEVVNSNSSISNQKINLKPNSNHKSNDIASKTRQEIDLNAVKAKLRKIKSTENDNKEEMDSLNLSEDNLLNINEDIADNQTPKSVSIGPSAENLSNLSLENKENSYQRKRTWSGSNISNEDTELDDVSSSHSNSIKKESNSSIVITVNPPKTEEIDEIDTNHTNSETVSETVSNIKRIAVPEPTDDDEEEEDEEEEEEEEEERIGAINSSQILSSKPFKSEMEKIEINVDYNCFNESDKDRSDRSNSSYLSDDNETSSSSSSCTDSDDEEISVSLKHRAKKKHFKNISLDTGDGGSTKDIFPDYSGLLGNNGELMIGKITTPTFRKKQEIERKQQKRAQTAISSKTWDYNELFGDTEDGEMVIGAITTPKFAKKRKDAKEKHKKRFSKTPEISAIKTSGNNNIDDKNDYLSTFDLSDILGDGFNLDDMDKNGVGGRHNVFDNDYDLIPESEERSYYYSDNDGSHETDGSFTESGSSQYSDYSDYTGDDDDEYPGDITPETPTNLDLVPPLKSHNLSISTSNVFNIADIVNELDITPSIEASKPEEDILPELPKEEEIERIRTANIEDILPPELQGSDSDDDEPEPAPSKLEIQVEEEKKIQKEFDEIRKEIERDMIDEEEMQRIENKRKEEIQDDLDAFFDTASFKSDDEEEQKKEEKEEKQVKIDRNTDNMDKVKMCDDLSALMAGLSDDDDDDDDDQQMIAAMEKRRSLEDDMNEMEEEDNEPLGDENIELNVNNDDIKDDEEEEEEEEEEHELDRMTLSELMADFKLNPNTNNRYRKLHTYFCDDLGIIFASDLVNYSPSKITQPPNFKSTKTRMLLTKMAKYVTNQVLHNYWTGSKAAKWAQLETNQLTYTFAPTQPITKQINMISTNDSPTVLFETSPVIISHDKLNDNTPTPTTPTTTTTNNNNNKTNRIQIVGHKMTCIDKKVELNKKYAAIVNIEKLPEINNKSKETHIVSMGVKFYFKDKQHRKNKLMETVYISDRCVIHRNDSYLEMLSIANCNMLDNGSQILIEVDNKKKYPIITFSQLRNGNIMKGNQKSIILDDFKQNDKSFAKIFVQQHYGNGIYSIHQTKVKRKQQQQQKQDDNDTNSSIKANIAKFRRSSSKQNIRKSKHRASI